MKWSKRILSMVIALVLTAGLFSGCGKQQNKANTGKTGQEVSSGDEADKKEKESGKTGDTAESKSDVPDYLNESGFPIVKEPDRKSVV